jgi:hypothetical protein
MAPRDESTNPRKQQEEGYQWNSKQFYVPDGGEYQEYIPPCSSRMADGVVRGGLVGIAWGLVFGLHDLPPIVPKSGEPATSIATRVGRNVFSLGSSVAVNGFGFAVFLGTFSGVSCLSERTRGAKDWINSAVGGVAAGALVGARSGNPVQTATIAAGTGALTTAIFLIRGSTDAS